MSAVEITKPGEGGAGGRGFCAKRHPERDDVWCRRLPHTQDVLHAAYVFAISEYEEWEWDTQF